MDHSGSGLITEENDADNALPSDQNNADDGLTNELPGTDYGLNAMKISLSENPGADDCTPMDLDHVECSLDLTCNIDYNGVDGSLTDDIEAKIDTHLISLSNNTCNKQMETNAVDSVLEAKTHEAEQNTMKLHGTSKTVTSDTQTENDKPSAINSPTHKIVHNHNKMSFFNDYSVEVYSHSVYAQQQLHSCEACGLNGKTRCVLKGFQKPVNLCDTNCLALYLYTNGKMLATTLNKETILSVTILGNSFSRKCFYCSAQINDEDPLVLSWETHEFCNDSCLVAFQNRNGSTCIQCAVNVDESNMGKYCVRFGDNIRQFCGQSCFMYYKNITKVCCYCQKDIISGGILALVTQKKVLKDFCTRECLNKYKILIHDVQAPPIQGKCSICFKDNPTVILNYKNEENKFCEESCLVKFKFFNNISVGKCDTCHLFFDSLAISEFVMYYEDVLCTFCSKACQNLYIVSSAKIVACAWCKVKKYNTDMIKRKSDTGTVTTCSLNCLNIHLSSVGNPECLTVCDQCRKLKQILYHISMTDDSIIKLCSYSCVLGFQMRFSEANGPLPYEPMPVSCPKRVFPTGLGELAIPIISAFPSFINTYGFHASNKKCSKLNDVALQTAAKKQMVHEIVIKSSSSVAHTTASAACDATFMSNVTGYKVVTATHKAVQTDEIKKKMILVPVPGRGALPNQMPTEPLALPFPFPIPIPVPCFIQTAKELSKKLAQQRKDIESKSSDQLGAEIPVVDGKQKDDATCSKTEAAAQTSSSPEHVELLSTSSRESRSRKRTYAAASVPDTLMVNVAGTSSETLEKPEM